LRFIRRARGQSIMMRGPLNSTEFWTHYQQLLAGKEIVSRPPLPSQRTFKALAIDYFCSDSFKDLKPRTRKDYNKYIGYIIEIWGNKDPRKIETHHIYKLHRANVDRWRHANYLVQVLLVLLNHARMIGYLNKEHGNPAHGVKLFKQKGGGWLPWPEHIRAEFEKAASPRARLVYELCIGTGQRISDVLNFRWDHFRDDAFDFTQGKTDKPMWIPLTSRLRAFLASVERSGETIVTGSSGMPATG
jgi:integrase